MSTSRIEQCGFNDDKIEELMLTVKTEVGSRIGTLAEEIRILNKYHDRMIKWLMAVVCIIALGKELLGVVEKLTSGVASVEIKQ